VVSKAVAVIGASTNRDKFGNKAVRAFRAQGYRVYPIHPTADVVEGLTAYRSVRDVPVSLDMATIYVPPEVGIGLLEDLERKGVPEIWLNPGAESAPLLQDAARRGLNVVVACSILGIGEHPGRF
jgi:predicted CoA-binding protein